MSIKVRIPWKTRDTVSEEMEASVRTATKSTTFLSLPREVREIIYELSLASSSGDSRINATLLPPEYQTHPSAEERHGSNYALGLLYCNRIVSYEASPIFYSRNIFSFLDSYYWRGIPAWLEKIGQRNRSYLRALEIQIDDSMRIRQLKDGTRFYYGHEICPYNDGRLPSRQAHQTPPEEVFESLDPALQRIFKILGGDKRKSTLEIYFHLDRHNIPGVVLFNHGFVAPFGFWSLDLPDTIEILRLHYAAKLKNGNDAIAVYWTGSTGIQLYYKNREHIKDCGWVILQAKPELRQQKSVLTPVPIMNFLLRRRNFTEEEGGLDAWKQFCESYGLRRLAVRSEGTAVENHAEIQKHAGGQKHAEV